MAKRLETWLHAYATSCSDVRPWLDSLSDAVELDIDTFRSVAGYTEMRMA